MLGLTVISSIGKKNGWGGYDAWILDSSQNEMKLKKRITNDCHQKGSIVELYNRKFEGPSLLNFGSI